MGLPIARYFLAAGVALRVHTERPRKPLSRQNCRTEIWSESLKASPFHGIHADRPVEGNGAVFGRAGEMPRAIVVGGSLGGLFAGNMLLRAGCDVTIIERAIGELEGRGAGLGVHPSMLEGLLAGGARVDAAVGVAVAGR